MGLGGHAAAILEASVPDGLLLGIDRDGEALSLAAERLRPWGDRVTLRAGDFRDLGQIAGAAGWASCDGVLFDLGASSLQLDDPARGFSFTLDGPLDMRMDRSIGATAADLIARLPERELSQVLWEFGEERWARRIARAIVSARAREAIATTGQVAGIVRRAIPRGAWPRRIDAATRTFQALRIAVNRELEGLDGALEAAVDLVRQGGRVAVISFHSLEDRIAKRTWRALAKGEAPRVRILTPRPVVPGDEEVARNPRARSAKLRAAERVGAPSGHPVEGG